MSRARHVFQHTHLTHRTAGPKACQPAFRIRYRDADAYTSSLEDPHAVGGVASSAENAVRRVFDDLKTVGQNANLVSRHMTGKVGLVQRKLKKLLRVVFATNYFLL